MKLAEREKGESLRGWVSLAEKKKKKSHVYLWEKHWEVLEVKDFVDWSLAD